MDRDSQTQRPFVWEAPPITPGPDDSPDPGAIVSATEYTGLKMRVNPEPREGQPAKPRTRGG